MDTPHVLAAKGHIATVRAVELELHDLHADKEATNKHQRVARLNQEIGIGLALAKIEATLAVAAATEKSAEAFREWTSLADEPLAMPAELVLLEQHEERDLAECIEAAQCPAALHARACPEADPHAWPGSPYGEGRVDS